MSSLWAALENSGADSMINSQLASALSADAQYWEESISPSQVRKDLQEADPSNPSHTNQIGKSMKWLLASISKGRDVSDFYPHVVKLVGVPSVQVRKLVYLYTVQYANHNASTRELSLLSINAFQRGLGDAEALIRALALRVLTTIRLADIWQIQMLAVQRCAADPSPYVRKCAAMALAKLKTEESLDLILEQLHKLLEQERNLMVLSSAVISFHELCPERLDLLHTSFHKLCELLTDMDEWGQVIVIDCLARYCRTFFQEPRQWKEGTAARIDRSKRVRRTAQGITHVQEDEIEEEEESQLLPSTLAEQSAEAGVQLPRRNIVAPSKIKRRVVRKGFYSDEEDESTEEEVFTREADGPVVSMSTAFRENPIEDANATVAAPVLEDSEDSELHPDHRKLLRSAMPLLKSRNAAVVLAVCSLHYYCGVSSIRVRSAMGKALVRIHRDHREIQYVILGAIKALATECPSAFKPFIQDFLVKALDPPFTRVEKLHVLVSLAIEPTAIGIVLKELSSYVRNGDRDFAVASVQAVGRIAELTRIVHDRQGERTDKVIQQRAAANEIALNCLHGLFILSYVVERHIVLGQCVEVMQCIIQMLQSDSKGGGDLMHVSDENLVQECCIRRIVVLLVASLNHRLESLDDTERDDDDESVQEGPQTRLRAISPVLPPCAVASSLWAVGEYCLGVSSPFFSVLETAASGASLHEIFKLLVVVFCELEACEREQAIIMAVKHILVGTSSDRNVCEQLLSLGRHDTTPDVRQQARALSGFLHASAIGLKFDAENLETSLTHSTLSDQEAREVIVTMKPSPSWLPVESGTTADENSIRFGTLSSLVGQKLHQSYIPLPKWAGEDSDSSLRPIKVESEATQKQVNGKTQNGGFYEESDSSSSSSSESGDSSSDSEESEPEQVMNTASHGDVLIPTGNPVSSLPSRMESSSSSSTSDDSSSSSDTGSDSEDVETSKVGTLLQLDSAVTKPTGTMNGTTASSIAADLQGIVISPQPVSTFDQPTDVNLDRDSGNWHQLVKPEHAGGLSVQARYLRGPSKTRQIQQLGMTVDKASVVCVQMRFEHQGKSVPVRRLRVLQRASSTGSSTIRPAKLVLPPEIPQLPPGKLVECCLGIDFTAPSDRDGSMQARLEIKHSSGGIPVELKPSIGELLLPCKRTITDFDQAVQRMQGFQRVESTFPLEADFASTLAKVMGSLALTNIDTRSDNFPLRLAGSLPASNSPVYIQLSVEAGQGKIIVCCEHALVVSSLMSLAKKSLQ